MLEGTRPDSWNASSRYPGRRTGSKVVPASGVDAHNGVARYAWKIIDAQNRHVMEWLDGAERIDDGRLQRILMFHGPLPAAE
jgi:hypothetical protein